MSWFETNDDDDDTFSYATGSPPSWIKEQDGHSTIEMLVFKERAVAASSEKSCVPAGTSSTIEPLSSIAQSQSLQFIMVEVFLGMLVGLTINRRDGGLTWRSRSRFMSDELMPLH